MRPLYRLPLIVSCRRRGINPQEYLTDVLRRLPAMNLSLIHISEPTRPY